MNEQYYSKMEEVFSRKYVRIERKESVYFLTMSYKLNILSYELIQQLYEAYDYMENKTEGPACLVTLSALPKTFSAGLDVKYLFRILDDLEAQKKYLRAYQSLLSKLLKLPMITIAVINGHTIAGGLSLALSHDYRIMNQEFGTISMNEIKNGFPIPPGVMSVLKHRIALQHYQYVVLTGEPITPQIAKEARIVDELVAQGKLKDRAFEMAKKFASSGKHRGAMKDNKLEMVREMTSELDSENMKPMSGPLLKPKL